MTFQLVRDAQRLGEVANEIAQAPVIGLDTETTGLSPYHGKLRLLQLNTGKNTWLIDLFHVQTLGPVATALQESKGVKVGQNLKFDQKFLLHEHGIELWPVFDTFRASNILHNGRGLRHDLYSIYDRELGLQPQVPDMSASGWVGDLSSEQLAYAAEDVEHLLMLREVMKPKLSKEGLNRTALIEFGAILPESSMELNGFYLDRDIWLQLYEENQRRRDELREQVFLELPHPKGQLGLPGLTAGWNLNSPKQKLVAIQKLGLDVENTREMTLAMHAAKYPVLRKLIEYNSAAKRCSAFGPDYLRHIDPKTGRIHTSFYPFLAAGRYSSSQPNLQQIPREKRYRKAFAPPPGRKIVVSDYSQVELRLVAQVSGDRLLREVYQKGLDAHRQTAALVNSVALDQVTDAMRQAAKAVNFGLCIAAGQLVLTDKGLVPIEAVTRDHFLWDGAEWVSHKGSFFMGYKGVITYDGLTATPDHRVYTRNGYSIPFWLARSSDRFGNLAIGEVSGDPVRYTAFEDRGSDSGRFSDWPSTEPFDFEDLVPVYDVLNSGPRHRFTVQGRVVSNCYGMGAEKLVLYAMSAYGIALKLSDAERFRKRYFQGYSGVQEWHRQELARGKTSGISRTMGGRIRYLQEDAHSEILNTPIQGCLPASVRVLSSSGYVSIGDLPSKGIVWTGTSWAPYTKVPKGVWQRAEVELANGQILQCDTRHKLLCVGKQSYEFVPFQKLLGRKACISMAAPLEFGSSEIESDAYWLGFSIGNGHSHRNYLSQTFGDRKGRYLKEGKAVEWVEFCASLGFLTQAPQVAPGKISITIEAKAFRERWEGFGYDWDWRSHTKQVPRGVWEGSLRARILFLLGLLDADGTVGVQGKTPPSIHLCQRRLLAQVQVLARTVGVESRLRGPYGATGSWRLDLNGGHLARLGYGDRVKETVPNVESPCFVVAKALECLGNKKSRSPSFRAIWKRLRKGGSTSCYTLRSMLAEFGWEALLYAWSEVVRVDVLPFSEPTYTLSVDHPLHRFDSEGVISKNSGADGLKSSLPIVYEKLKKYGGRAKLVHMVHDEIVIEADDDPEELAAIDRDLKAGMVEGMRPFLPDVPVVVDGSFGSSWAEH